jgi:hypothetical protein
MQDLDVVLGPGLVLAAVQLDFDEVVGKAGDNLADLVRAESESSEPVYAGVVENEAPRGRLAIHSYSVKCNDFLPLRLYPCQRGGREPSLYGHDPES